MWALGTRISKVSLPLLASSLPSYAHRRGQGRKWEVTLKAHLLHQHAFSPRLPPTSTFYSFTLPTSMRWTPSPGQEAKPGLGRKSSLANCITSLLHSHSQEVNMHVVQTHSGILCARKEEQGSSFINQHGIISKGTVEYERLVHFLIKSLSYGPRDV